MASNWEAKKKMDQEAAVLRQNKNNNDNADM